MTEGESLSLGNVTLLPESGEMLVDGTCHYVARTTVNVLAHLMRATPRVVQPWLLYHSPEGARVYVQKLRHLLADTGASLTIVTHRGFGWAIMETKQ